MKATRRSLYLSAWLSDFAGLLVVFVASREMAERGTGLLVMGLVGAAFSIASTIITPWSGRLSDRIGRRRLMVLGLATVLAGLALCLTLFQYNWAFAATYLLVGGGLGLFYPAQMAWLTQGHDPKLPPITLTRTLLGFCIAWNLGIVSAQTTGGWIFDSAGPRPALLLAAFLTLANLAVILRIKPRSVPTPVDDPALASEFVGRRTQSASFARLCWIANVGGAFSISVMFHLFPKLAVELQIPPDRHGLILAASRAIVIATYLAMHFSHFWHNRFSVSVAAQLLGAAGLMTIFLGTTTPVLLLGLSGLSVLVGYNYFASMYYSAAGSEDDSKGAALGLHEGTLALGFAVGTAGGGLLGQWAGVRAPYALAAAVVLALLFVQITVILRRRRRQRHAQPSAPPRQ